MPYIPKNIRRAAVIDPRNAGELNYAITCVLLRYIHELSPSYKTFNDILGALEGAKQEFYRRVVAPYEDSKCASNGDVYP